MIWMLKSFKMKPFQPNNKTSHQVIKSLFVGGFSTVVDYTLWALTKGFLGTYWGNIFGYTIGTLANYWMSNSYVFASKNIQNKWLEGSLFFALSMSGMLLNTLTLWVLIEKLQSNDYIAKIIATILTFAFNFITRKKILYQ